jgi:hypothetical protein
MNGLRSVFLAVLCTATTAGVAAEASLAERVQHLKDRQDIYALMMEYGRAISARNAPALARLFATDGVWKGNVGEAKGPAEIQKMLEITISKIPPGQEHRGGFHIMSNIEIDLKGDTAASKSRWMWVIPSPTGYPVGQRSGYFEDTLVREKGVWRFRNRLTVTQLPLEQHDEEKNIWRSDFRDAQPPKK